MITLTKDNSRRITTTCPKCKERTLYHRCNKDKELITYCDNTE